MNPIWNTAKESLESNCVESCDGPLTVAGANQFKTFWIRDFCYAVPGLMELGHTEQVKSQLSTALKYQRADGLLPRGLDIIDPKLRVLSESLSLPQIVRRSIRNLEYSKRKLKPEYLGEHKTLAADSNVLVLLACLKWSEKTGDNYFWTEHRERLKKCFEFILSTRIETLLFQPAFSDWQDSARREGHTFYLNLLFYRVLLGLQKLKIDWASNQEIETLQKKLWDLFYNPEVGLFQSKVLSDPSEPQYSLESQLWCIEEDLFSKFISKQQLWKNLKESNLWMPFPGRPVWPIYPDHEISWTTKIVGLRHYHDKFYWSWLLGESLKVSKLMGDHNERTRINEELTRLVLKYNTIHEVFEMNPQLTPVSRFLYRSEKPFSWGAAKIIEGLSARVLQHEDRLQSPLE